jgi:lipopolysaccharide export system permease protein
VTGGLLDRYIGFRFLRMVGMAVLSFVVIFVSVDAFDHFSRWVDKDVSIEVFLRYYFYGLPYIIVLVLPIAVLLSSLFLVSSLARRNELVAIRAAGLSIPRMFLPLLVIGLLISMFELAVGDFVVADSLYRQSIVKRVEIDGNDPIDYSRRSNFAHRSLDGSIFEIGFFDGKTGVMNNVSMEWLDDSARVTRRIDATSMSWIDSAWVAMGAASRQFGPSGEVVYSWTDTLPMPGVSDLPEDFGSRQKSPDEMNLFELSEHIDRVRAAGGDVRGDLVELYLTILFPLSNLIMILVGAPLATRNPRSGRSVSIGIAIFLAFLFFSLLRFGQTLGHKGAIPPLLAASLAELIFAGIGLVLLWRTSRQ